jgi:hypothetical protein
VKTPPHVDARKVRIGEAEALALVRDAARLLVARGKAFAEHRVTDASPGDAEIAKLVIGRSGNLRAPAARIGDAFVVGFHPEAWRVALER